MSKIFSNNKIRPPKEYIKSIEKFRIDILTSNASKLLIRKTNARILKRVAFNNDRTPRKIEQSFNSAKKIQKIFFIFGFHIGNSERSQLNVCNVLKRLTLLRSLDFRLTYFFHVSDSSLDFISKSLTRLKFLKEIALGFYRFGDELTSIGLQSFSQCSKKWICLQKIHLDFSYCFKISDTGLLHISKGFKRLLSLQKVTLKFEGCGNISGFGLRNLGIGLNGLKNLQIINLNFDFCDNITGEELCRFYEIIFKLPSIQVINLSYLTDDKVSKAMLEEKKDKKV